MINSEAGAYLLHICRRQEWETALNAGEYRPPSLETEGFIHCSLEYQILEVANQFYRQNPDLVLLWIKPRLVESKIVFERPPGDAVNPFPHIYGALNLDAVVSVMAFPIQEDGYFHSIPSPTNLSGAP
jgi:uncharacterized protein (DUF952 family)